MADREPSRRRSPSRAGVPRSPRNDRQGLRPDRRSRGGGREAGGLSRGLRARVPAVVLAHPRGAARRAPRALRRAPGTIGLGARARNRSARRRGPRRRRSRRDRHQRTQSGSQRHFALQLPALHPRRRRDPRCPSQARADRGRAPHSRRRRRQHAAGARPSDRQAVGAHLLGELHAAGALRALCGGSGDLRRTHLGSR